ETQVVGEVQDSGAVAEGQSILAANLATTDTEAAGENLANPIASPQKKKRTKAKAAQKTKADKSSDAILEPSHSVEPD
ncbi:hypothetical protein A2U01_0097000, partial [Trifolium medium]|nr:hypothetical protein [Trifolium medium]